MIDELINKQVNKIMEEAPLILVEKGSGWAIDYAYVRTCLRSSMKKVGEEMFKGLKVFDKTEKREKWVVMLEWNMDNPKQLIEVHTWPIAIYKAGYRLKNDTRGEKTRRIDELEFNSLTDKGE